ncbi:hypothetical protein [Pseudomonas sp. Pseu.R1]|uniref:hypothetical protein n=1 Tax=Pseudomonas sp. Pseu.R1 TaxID=3379818 RepID=UPI003B9564E9
MAPINRVDNMITWDKVCDLAKGTIIDLSDLVSSDLGAGVHKTSDSQYVITKINNFDLKAAEVVAVYWAVSEGGFRRAYFNDLESDEGITCAPPVSLLPENAADKYGSIRKALAADENSGFMEHASYRIMGDRAFVYRALENKEMAYLFRGGEEKNQEKPFCIIVKKF